MPVHFLHKKAVELSTQVVVVGGGFCGLVAALAARELGVEVVLAEREPALGGSLPLTSGLIPAADSRYQRAAGISDSPQQYAGDIQRRSKGGGDVLAALALARASAPTLEWLADRYGIPWVLSRAVPAGHAVRRLHGLADAVGPGLIGRLERAAREAGVALLTGVRVLDLFAAEDGRLSGLRFARADGGSDELGLGALVLACGGFAAHESYLSRFIPEVAGARSFGHPGSTGDAIHWASQLGAALRNMGSYQSGLGFAGDAVAGDRLLEVPAGLIAAGAFLVNARAARFADEIGCGPQIAAEVLRQPGGCAWMVFDERIHGIGMGAAGYREAYSAGAIRRADSAEALAQAVGLPAGALAATFAQVREAQRGREPDALGRDFSIEPAFELPLYAARVAGALLQTQGGVAVDAQARVVRADGTPFPNLCAAGAAACGISGPGPRGYLEGNGLLAALSTGRMAGLAAARAVLSPPDAALTL
jgi:fumarate reductase flavoprotein subunit